MLHKFTTTIAPPTTTTAAALVAQAVSPANRGGLKLALLLALAPWTFLTANACAQEATERANVRKILDRISAQQKKNAGPYKVTIPNTTVSYDMASIPAGEFTMGSPDSDPRHKKDEQPQHKVRVDVFWMQTHEVTWDEYRLFMFAEKDENVDAVSRPTRPYVEMSFGMGIEGYPAISMTQHGANKYAEWLSARTGEFYRLPTEAEWEYACRAGSATRYFFGSDPAQL